LPAVDIVEPVPDLNLGRVRVTPKTKGAYKTKNAGMIKNIDRNIFMYKFLPN
jgi:hypothetical protein